MTNQSLVFVFYCPGQQEHHIPINQNAVPKKFREISNIIQSQVEFLQKMCSNDVDIPVGHIVHTGMQNQWGGYENDCTVTRLAENR